MRTGVGSALDGTARSRDSLIPLIITASLVLSLALCFPPAEGWSNGGYSADPDNPDYGTHDWIADMALNLQTRDVSHFKSTYHDSYLIGTEAPDNSEYIGDSTNHHVYYYADGTVQDDASAIRARAMYDSALARLRAGDFDAAAYYMGAMTHYVADLGVFGHTMGAYTDWGNEVHHSDYENEIESLLGSLTLPSTVTLGYMSAYDAAMNLAETSTFGMGTIRSNVWMDSNYDWEDPEFVESAKQSLYKSVGAAAAAVNHLLTAAEPEPDEPAPDDLDDSETHEPGPPASLDAYIEDGHVLLVWSPPQDDGGTPVVEYLVYRGQEPSGVALLATVSGNAQTFEDMDVKKGSTYYYCVAARNAEGIGDMSEMEIVTVPQDRGSSTLLWPAALSAVAAVAASAGALVLRQRSKAERQK